MSGQHTQGRLTFLDGRPGRAYLTQVDSDGQTVAVASYIEPADARRLAACWNACNGMSTDDLELMASAKGVHGELAANERMAIAAIRAAQHANTDLAAARALLRDVSRQLDQTEFGVTARRIRAYLDASEVIGAKGGA